MGNLFFFHPYKSSDMGPLLITGDFVPLYQPPSSESRSMSQSPNLKASPVAPYLVASKQRWEPRALKKNKVILVVTGILGRGTIHI